MAWELFKDWNDLCTSSFRLHPGQGSRHVIWGDVILGTPPSLLLLTVGNLLPIYIWANCEAHAIMGSFFFRWVSCKCADSSPGSLLCLSLQKFSWLFNDLKKKSQGKGEEKRQTGEVFVFRHTESSPASAAGLCYIKCVFVLGWDFRDLILYRVFWWVHLGTSVPKACSFGKPTAKNTCMYSHGGTSPCTTMANTPVHTHTHTTPHTHTNMTIWSADTRAHTAAACGAVTSHICMYS